MQLEKSPHVRTGGRAVFHGSWTRLNLPAVDDADSYSSFSSVGDVMNGERKDSGSHCRLDPEVEAERGERGQGFGIRRQRRRAHRGEQHRQAVVNLPRFAWGLVKKLRGDAGGDGRGGSAIKTNEMACMETPQKQKTKRSRRSATATFVPHGEGYVEFLDGWGVSQVSNEFTIALFRVREPDV